MRVREINTKLSFIGRHNKVKALSLLLLSQHHWKSHAEIARIVGSPQKSMSVLVGRWHGWGLVKRAGPCGCYRYDVSTSGVKWLNRHLVEMPLGDWLSGLPGDGADYFERVFGIWRGKRDARWQWQQ